MLLNSSEQNETESDSLIWERIFSLCVQRGWDIGRLAREANVSRTTLHHWQQGKTTRPRNLTIYKLAEALQVDPASLLNGTPPSPPVQPPFSSPAATNPQPDCGNSDDLDFEQRARLFDRQTNWAIQSVCEQTPSLFENWTDSQWDELFSSFGTGGEMNEEGIRREAAAINARQETVYQLQVVLETHLAEAARGVIRALYESLQSDDCAASFDKP